MKILGFFIISLIFIKTQPLYCDNINIGEKIEDFTLLGVDEIYYNLSSSLESSINGVIIIFWSTRCFAVQSYNDRINDYVKYYIEKGFIVFGINSNSLQGFGEVVVHANENKYIFPMLKDQNKVVADKIGATTNSQAFIIGKDMTILYKGRITDNQDIAKQTTYDLQNAVDEIATNKEVTIKETKSFGCLIH